MIENLYVSTNCFGSNDLQSVLEHARELNIKNIELSSGLSSHGYSEAILEGYATDFRFILHNYFPPENTGLVLNLASLDTQIREASINFCKSSIKLCTRVNSPLYGVHSGFTYDPSPTDLGQNQTHLTRHPVDLAKSAFRDSLIEIIDFATEKQIKFCIENNVVPAFNLIEGENLMDLMASPSDFSEFNHLTELSDVKYLLDFGHLNVTSKAMGFSRDEFIATVRDRVLQIQVTGNDGVTDMHGPVSKNDWFLPYLSQFIHTPVSIESKNLSEEELLNSITYVTDAMNKNNQT